jgi:hypothetical protein
MPLLSVLLHLEKQGRVKLQRGVQVPGVSGLRTEGVQPTAPAVSHQELYFFDLQATTIFSLGCGVGPVQPWNKSFVNASNPPRHYYTHGWPYGEVGKAMQVAHEVPDASEIGWLSGVAAVAGATYLGLVAALLYSVGPAAIDATDLRDDMKDILNHHAQFGLGSTLNTLAFLKDGSARNAWTVQEAIFRSPMYRGDFRRFQLSLDRPMQTDGLWKYHPAYAERREAAKKTSYTMPASAKIGHTKIWEHTYDIISIWDEFVSEGMSDFIPGLEPLGSISLKWIDCIGERFADAIEEYSKSKNTSFMGSDLVDSENQDVFVSPAAKDDLTGARWLELKSLLGG